MKKLIALCLCLLWAAGAVRAQSFLFRTDVRSDRGPVMPGTNVWVCAANTSGSPCSPTTSVYKDSALTQLITQPIIADAHGNYQFYAAPATYTVTYTGPGIPSGYSFQWQGTSGSGGGGGEPPSTIPARYVAPYGADTNDGLTWATAKLTWDAAACSLPGGSCSAPIRIGAGTVYGVSGSYYCSADQSAGFWVMTSADPNYSSPPTCWMHNDLNAGQALVLQGVGDAPGGSNTQEAKANILQSHGADNNQNKPALWVQGVSLTFRNLAQGGPGSPGRGVVVGQCSDLSLGCPAAYIKFDNDGFGAGTGATTDGPGMDLTGSGTFGIKISDSVIQANGTASAGSDVAAAILIDGRSTTGVGDFKFYNINTNGGGGIKFYGGSNGGGELDVYGLLEESSGLACSPGVELTSTGGGNTFWLQSVFQSDCSSGTAVQVDAGNAQDVTVVAPWGTNHNVVGPATILSQYNAVGNYALVDPIVNQQLGYSLNRVLGRIDIERKATLPHPVWFSNIVLPVASWFGQSGGTVNTGTANDPTGGSNAVRITGTGANSSVEINNLSGSQTTTHAVGDWIIWGAWVRLPQGVIPGAHTAPVAFNQTLCVSTYQNQGPAASLTLPLTDTNWQWMYQFRQIASVTNSGTCGDFLDIYADATHDTDVWGPVLIEIPAASNWDAQTVMDYAQSLASYDQSCSTGTVCSVATTPYNLGGVTVGPNLVATNATTAGLLALGGNGSNPSLPANSVGLLGPSSGSFTKYYLQFPTAAPSGTQYLGCATPSSNVSTCAWGAGGGGGSGLNGAVIYTSAQTGSSSDNGKLVIMNCSCAYTLPNPQPSATWSVWIATTSPGTNVPTVALASGMTFQGSSTTPLYRFNGPQLLYVTSNPTTSTDYQGQATLGSVMGAANALPYTDANSNLWTIGGFSCTTSGACGFKANTGGANTSTGAWNFFYGSNPDTLDVLGGEAIGQSNGAGVNTYLSAGRGTGTGALAITCIKGTVKGTSGTVLQTQVWRSCDNLQTTLTNNVATTILTPALAINSVAGGFVSYCVNANNGTDYQTQCGAFTYSLANKASTVTTNIGSVTVSSNANSTGSLTVTPSLTAAGVLQINGDSSLSGPTVDIVWSVKNFSDVNDVTPTVN